MTDVVALILPSWFTTKLASVTLPCGADITPEDVPECAHRGKLGMWVIASHRGQGIGRRLLDACLAHAPRAGMNKVELTVYTSNTAAVALYHRSGFIEIGVVKDYRRVDGVIYDASLMERFV